MPCRYPASSSTVDKFKDVNDAYGHAAGDEVLVGITKACSGLLRQSDLVGRLGGEEFGILLPHTDGKSTFEVAEKIRQSIAALNFNFGGKTIVVTASSGICALSERATDIDTMLDGADFALYHAKTMGRNRSIALAEAPGRGEQPRRRVFKAGRIIFDGRASAIDCTVKTFSDTGGRIEVSSTIGIPPVFRLAIAADKFESACRVIAQTERHLEVVFV